MRIVFTGADGIDRSRMFRGLNALRIVLPTRLMKSLWFRFLTGPGYNVSVAPSARFRGTGTLEIDSGFEIRQGSIVECFGEMHFGENVFINAYCFIYQRAGSRAVFGENVLVSPFCSIDASGGLTIGADTMIGPGARINSANHGMNRDRPYREQPFTADGITIGRNVWIGSNVVLNDGVTIGDDAIVGAGAVVTKDVPAGHLALGIPARTRPRRANDSVIARQPFRTSSQLGPARLRRANAAG